ncbi:MAG: creatininase family protein [Alphaproteobacteria bacterium]|nr:creatininase family protein [Alphaproteobacteria bacterium]
MHKLFHAEGGGNWHAHDAETSMIMLLRPDLIHLDKGVDEPDRSVCCFFSYTVDKESEFGGVGSPSQASVAFGRKLLDACVETLSAQLRRALKERTALEDWPAYQRQIRRAAALVARGARAAANSKQPKKSKGKS